MAEDGPKQDGAIEEIDHQEDRPAEIVPEKKERITFENQVSYFRWMRLLDPNSEHRAQIRNELIELNTGLIGHVIDTCFKEYAGLHREDLPSMGNIGLTVAVDHYDPERGVKFSTYGNRVIRTVIAKELKDEGDLIHLPWYVTDDVSRLNRFEEEFQKREQRRPTSDEMRNYLDELTTRGAKFAVASQHLNDTLSLDAPLSDETGDAGSTKLSDVLISPELDPEDALIQSDMARQLDVAIERLPNERDKFLIRARYGLLPDDPREWSFAEIGQRLGVTRQTARITEVRILDRLRKQSPEIE